MFYISDHGKTNYIYNFIDLSAQIKKWYRMIQFEVHFSIKRKIFKTFQSLY